MQFQYEKQLCDYIWTSGVYEFSGLDYENTYRSAYREFALKDKRFDFFIIKKDIKTYALSACILEVKLKADYNAVLQILKYKSLLKECTDRFKEICLTIVCLEKTTELEIVCDAANINLIVCEIELNPEPCFAFPSFFDEEDQKLTNVFLSFHKETGGCSGV